MIDPLHQFKISPIVDFSIGKFDLSFSNSALAMMIAVLGVFLLFSIGIKNRKVVPGKLQSLVEMSYKLVTSMVNENIGTSGIRYLPFVFSVFFFILFGNLLGMIPFMFTFTSHIIVSAIFWS